ncbi:MAG: hypothetical protein EPN92_04370 [Chitinophagaceae bacterium]|nr:MAG: hypothetical protein EPN92_04370 [Chitinophagaceae bacterium]
MSAATLKPRLSFLFISTLFLFFSSCRVTLVPPYDADMAGEISKTAKMVDKFYITMMEKTKNENNGRTYEKFSDQYIDIEVELNSLLYKNKVKPLNAHSTRICEITLQLWNKYKEEHKTDNELSDGLIRLNRKYLSDLFYAMQVAEEGKKIAAAPTN